MSYLMMDLASLDVSDVEKHQLQHPAVGGVILFSRNYQNRAQLCGLVSSIREIRSDILIAVDHEGGRVQRFLDGFTHIPAMGDILPAAEGDISKACEWAKELAFVMAVELLSCDIDLSFAPVLDLNKISQVIGKRSFSVEPEQVVAIARAWIAGMHEAGMFAVGKHFPGHGSVAADSHVAMPVDPRSFDQIQALDMKPFAKLINENMLDGVMPAHVVYSQVDPNPAGFSSFWLQKVLRQQLVFKGVIFSDDLGMHGAAFAGGYQQRAKAALDAGCDMILLCNDAVGVADLLDSDFDWPDLEQKVGQKCSPLSLKADPAKVMQALEQTERWQQGVALARMIHSQ